MNIPNSFKKAIKDTFYDKTIAVYTYKTVTDEGGFVKREKVLTSITTINGNVRFTDLAELQEEYGLKEEVAISISSDSSVDVGKPIGYGGETYKVIKVIPRDSHNLILGSKWL